MNETQRKQLLAALIKDRDQTREALEFIKQQKQHVYKRPVPFKKSMFCSD